MKRGYILVALVMWIGVAGLGAQGSNGTGYTLVGWNDLGMHCMDADYSVFSILPPYNVIHAQLIDPSGDLVTNPSGITVTYEAVADPEGSINVSSINKTNFWDWVTQLFGASPAPDEGLAGDDMPGAVNTPQPMHFDTAFDWFSGEGIPITPYDDAGNKNYYPMMRLVARNASGTVLATTRIVLPVSDEMTCSSCHGSGSGPAARPSGGWINDPDPERDYRLNILLLHDELEGGTAQFTAALAAAGYNSGGLYATVDADATPILCDACHASNALPGTGQAGIPPLTQAIHSMHAAGHRPRKRHDPRRVGKPHGVLHLPPRLRHPLSARRDGQRGGRQRRPRDAVPELPRQHEPGGRRRPRRVVRPAHLPELPHRHGDQQQRQDPLHLGLRLLRRAAGRRQQHLCHQPQHSGCRRLALPFLDRPRRSPVRGLPRLHPRDLSLEPPQRQPAEHRPAGSRRDAVDCSGCHDSQPRTVSGGPHGMHPVGKDWVDRHEDAAERQRRPVPHLPRQRLPRHRAVAGAGRPQ